MPDIFALVDCNNFYASCERLFVPSIDTKPVLVLSNNDGCVIARSQEAKSLGIKMGIPVFEIGHIIRNNNVKVFSTNYSLYGDISQRVMGILAESVPQLEIYSIDEAFLDLSFVPREKLDQFAEELRKKVTKFTGIPVTIGIAYSKTLAKAANQLAKSISSFQGILNFCGNEDKNDLLDHLDVKDVWGVGDKFRAFFQRNGIHTAMHLKHADPYHVRNHLGIVGQRLVLELNDQPCYPLDDNPEQKKEICTSRSFGKPLTTFNELEEATTTYASKVAKKLRSQNSLAGSLLVFVMTNKFASGPQYVNYQLIHLPSPSNQTPVFIHYSRKLLKSLFRDGYKYKKSGVIVSDLIPDDGQQTSLWEKLPTVAEKRLMQVIDGINERSGSEAVRYAAQGTGVSWKMRQNNLSPHYTTRWEDLLTVDMDQL